MPRPPAEGPGPYRAERPAAAPRVLVHRPERGRRVTAVILLVLATLLVAADLFGTTTTVTCTRAVDGKTCVVRTSSILWPRRRVLDVWKTRVVGLRSTEGRDFEAKVTLPAGGEDVVLHETRRRAEVDAIDAGRERLDRFLDDPSIRTVTVTFGPWWRRAPAAVAAMLFGLGVIGWALRRTRIIVDERRGIIRIERLRFPLRREVQTIARRDLRWIAVEGTEDGGVRLMLAGGEGEYLSLLDFRPASIDAPAERARLEAFLGEEATSIAKPSRVHTILAAGLAALVFVTGLAVLRIHASAPITASPHPTREELVIAISEGNDRYHRPMREIHMEAGERLAISVGALPMDDLFEPYLGTVRWSAPAGVTIDPATGTLALSPDTPDRAQLDIEAVVGPDRWTIPLRVHVYRLDQRPILGSWKPFAVASCQDEWATSQPFAALELRPNDRFRVVFLDAVRSPVELAGSYTYDRGRDHLVLRPDVQHSFDFEGEGRATAKLPDPENPSLDQLHLEGIWLGSIELPPLPRPCRITLFRSRHVHLDLR